MIWILDYNIHVLFEENVSDIKMYHKCSAWYLFLNCITIDNKLCALNIELFQ